MFDFITNPDFLNALAAMIGPLAFFAAPTEEIEALIYNDNVAEREADLVVEIPVGIDEGYAEAA